MKSSEHTSIHHRIADEFRRELERRQLNDRKVIELNTMLAQKQSDYKKASEIAIDKFKTDDIVELSNLLKTRTAENALGVKTVSEEEDGREKEMDDLSQLLGMS